MKQIVIGANPIRQPDKRGLRDALRLILFTAALALPFLGYVAFASVYQLAVEYQVSALVAKRQQLEKERDRLAVQKASLLSLPVVEEVAREKLGMVPEDSSEQRADQPPPAAKQAKAQAADAAPNAPAKAKTAPSKKPGKAKASRP
jgi:cell division protein FtsL